MKPQSISALMVNFLLGITLLFGSIEAQAQGSYDTLYATSSNSSKLFQIDLNNSTTANATAVKFPFKISSVGFDSTNKKVFALEEGSQQKSGIYLYSWGMVFSGVKNQPNSHFDKCDVRSSGEIYAMNSQNNLYRYSTFNSSPVALGAISGLPSTNGHGDLCFDSKNSFYLLTENGLYFVDISNMSANFIFKPSFLSSSKPTGLALNKQGVLIASDNSSNANIYELDPSTGSSKLLGKAGIAISDLGTKHTRPKKLSPGIFYNIEIQSVCNGLWKVINKDNTDYTLDWSSPASKGGKLSLSKKSHNYVRTKGIMNEMLTLSMNSTVIDTAQSNNKDCNCGISSKKLRAFLQGTDGYGNNLGTNYSTARVKVCDPDSNYCAIGKSSDGSAKFVMEFDRYVTGYLNIAEVSSSNDPEEKCLVYVSGDNQGWELIGEATNKVSKFGNVQNNIFDLEERQIKYVKLVDQSNSNVLSNDGFDVDAVSASSEIIRDCAPNRIVYGTNYKQNQLFYRFNPVTWNHSNMQADLQFGAGAVAYHNGNDRVYYVEKNSPNRVAFYDVKLDSHFVINNTGLNVLINKLVVADDGKIYAAGNNDRLYMIDPLTGAFSWQKKLNISQNTNGGGDMAFSNSGTLYYLAKGGLFKIDTSNHAINFLGKPGFLNSTHATGMIFDNDQKKLFATDATTSASKLYTLDTTNGNQTFVRQLDVYVNDLTSVSITSNVVSRLIGVNNHDRNIYSVTPDSGQINLLDQNRLFGSSACALTKDGESMYYTDRYNSHQIARYDFNTGTHTNLGSNSGGQMIIRMATDYNDTLYASGDGSPVIYRVNSGNGQLIKIGSVTGLPSKVVNGDMAFAPNNKLYFLDRSGFYHIDMGNLKATFKGKPGFISNKRKPSALAFDHEGNCYATNFITSSAAKPSLYLIDTANGSSTWVTDLNVLFNDFGIRTSCDSSSSISGNSVIVQNEQYYPVSDEHGEVLLGLEENEVYSHSIFPNPANADVPLSIKITGKSNITVKFYNNLGQKAKEVTVNEGTNKIDISELNSGAYHLRIKEGSNVLSNEQLIVR